MAARRREFVDDRDLSGDNHHKRNTDERALFLEWAGRYYDPDVDELADLWEQWQSKTDGEQSDLGRFDR